VNKKEVANIIAEIPGFENPDEIVVLGAHYDTIEGTPGADDNGSAIAGLLEIYRLLSHFKFKKTIRFVAFTLEEPPFFDTELMGSMHYATLCKKRKDNIVLMVCLEMIGFGWKKIEQEFPPHEIRMKAPKTGNFLTVVSLPSSCQYTYLWKKIYNSHAKNKIFDIIGPASIPGIALSDHASFVKNGYPGIMLCDTGFYRNKNYHTEDDTINTINFVFLAQNIMYSFYTLKEILNMGLLNSNHFEEEK
jgi:Zn-dependent M28 family amino/carboxypeptidase